MTRLSIKNIVFVIFGFCLGIGAAHINKMSISCEPDHSTSTATGIHGDWRYMVKKEACSTKFYLFRNTRNLEFYENGISAFHNDGLITEIEIPEHHSSDIAILFDDSGDAIQLTVDGAEDLKTERR